MALGHAIEKSTCRRGPASSAIAGQFSGERGRRARWGRFPEQARFGREHLAPGRRGLAPRFEDCRRKLGRGCPVGKVQQAKRTIADQPIRVILCRRARCTARRGLAVALDRADLLPKIGRSSPGCKCLRDQRRQKMQHHGGDGKPAGESTLRTIEHGRSLSSAGRSQASSVRRVAVTQTRRVEQASAAARAPPSGSGELDEARPGEP